MFDIGFFEIIFIMVIALLVVGPERLPRIARTAGLWLGKMRGFVSSVKADIDQELAISLYWYPLQIPCSPCYPGP